VVFIWTGDEIRNFNVSQLISEIESIDIDKHTYDESIKGYNWEGFIANSLYITGDENCRFDYKFWDLQTIKTIETIQKRLNFKSILELNLIETKRGNSPSASDYVSEYEGFALVVKAGSNISKTGKLLTSGDYIEEAIYQSYKEKNQVLQEGDILLSSTGDGTLGKCSVYRNNNKPAIADGHVTVIRVDSKKVHPEYLCDFLRKGFGADQIIRLYTGSTGLIEIAPEDVNKIIIPPLPSLPEQKKD
jgi:type I restriction enzyme M protein